VASRHRVALIEERAGALPEPSLPEALSHLQPRDLDLVLVEGFKHARYPKIELHRPSLGRPLIHRRDPDVIAVATDAPLQIARPLPVLELNDPLQIRDFVLQVVQQSRSRSAMG
jgi:molybdopterin-guanine dinucleotide biosynthesis protein B